LADSEPGLDAIFAAVDPPIARRMAMIEAPIQHSDTTAGGATQAPPDTRFFLCQESVPWPSTLPRPASARKSTRGEIPG